jgi:hypothetical protein
LCSGTDIGNVEEEEDTKGSMEVELDDLGTLFELNKEIKNNYQFQVWFSRI